MAAGFHLNGIAPLMMREIEVATLHPKGCTVVPQAMTPAKYDPPQRWPNTAMVFQGVIKGGF